MFGFKVDDAAKYVAIGSASFYAIGFLIVSANLARYGDFDPSFTPARYIFAGFLFLWYLMPISWLVLKYMHDLSSLSSIMDELKSSNKLLFFYSHFKLSILKSW